MPAPPSKRHKAARSSTINKLLQLMILLWHISVNHKLVYLLQPALFSSSLSLCSTACVRTVYTLFNDKSRMFFLYKSHLEDFRCCAHASATVGGSAQKAFFKGLSHGSSTKFFCVNWEKKSQVKWCSQLSRNNETATSLVPAAIKRPSWA